ncbi:SgrR family transcriptional regulator [Enterococcus sp. S22(2020)]|nr:SgrR family transcriptional regulator [Enterococcus sp. S23]MCA5015692.1 SgrR family transcriptional regulator [Enterococcus sp. S22(2020)]
MGRGNYSTLTFQEEFQQEIKKISQKALREDQLDEIIQLLQLEIPKEWFGDVFKELQGMFGIQRYYGNQETIRYILRRPLTSLDPLKTSISREAFMIRQLGDTLLRYDEKSNSLVPSLAHHWKSSDDYCRWTFFLRKGVQFHHGRTLTSKDVEYTLLRAKNEHSVVAWQLKNVKEIHCINDFKIEVILKIGEPFFGHYVSTGNLTILPHDILFDEKKWISTGPFKMKAYSEYKIVLEAFEGYYAERPLMDRVEFWVVENQKQPMAVAVHNGEREEYDYIERARNDNGVEFLIFNFKRKTIVDNAKFREAIYHMFDVNELKKVMDDIGMPASNYFFDQSSVIRKDHHLINGLLKEAGYAGETLVLGTFDYSNAKQKAWWFQKKAAEYNVNIEIREMPIDQAFYTKEFEEETDMLILRDIPVTDKELAFLEFCSNPRLMCQRFFSQKMLSCLEQKLNEMKFCENHEQRAKEIEKIDRWLSDHHYLIYISHPSESELIHCAIENKEKDLFLNLNLRLAWAEDEKKEDAT